MFWFKPGSGFSERFPGLRIRVFHTAFHRRAPRGQAEAVRPRGAAGRSVRSGAGRQAAVAADLSSHMRRSRRGTFAVTAGFRMPRSPRPCGACPFP